MELSQKIAVVTGASDGIGQSLCAVLRERGAKLALVARSADKLAKVSQPGELVVRADLERFEDRQRTVSEVIARFGQIDVLVNNAGIGIYGETVDVPLTEARRLFELNFFAPLDLIQLAIPHIPAGGCIVNVASVAGKLALPWSTLYSASKYALDALSDGLRVELLHRGIHVMSVCPGHIATAFQQHMISGQPPPAIRTSRNPFVLSADECARRIVRAIERDAGTVVIPAIYWLAIAAARLCPPAVEQLMRRMLPRHDT